MSARLFVGNLDPRVREKDLKTFFSRAGTVRSITIPLDRDTGRARGFAFVEFGHEEEAGNALEQLDGEELEGRAVRLSPAREREGGGERRRGKPRGRPRREGRSGGEEDGNGFAGDRGWRESRERGSEAGERGSKPHRRGKHGSDRKRGRGTRRFID